MKREVSKSFFVILFSALLKSACSVCEIRAEIEREREYCLGQIENKTTGCSGMWDKLMCWPSAGLEEVVTLPCPKYFSYFTSQPRIGNLSKTCTEDGCFLHLEFILFGAHDTTTISSKSNRFFSVAARPLCRKLHCTRNYIHMNLFVSFVLKATSVFVKDVILYPGDQPEECPSSVGCKAVLVFFQYGIMASYFWLLVEGLYLYALLAVSFFSEKKYFWCYILIGWGVPAIFISAWVGTKVYLKDPGCWDIIEGLPWWIIKTPILIAILVNFFLFICIIRILQQKINCPDIGRKESNQYSRLAKSTLLLIPLFGMNYIIFAYIPEHIQLHVRMVFDLVLGSFQGFIVAVLYCFLNGEVQSEVRRKWRRWMLQRFLSTADTKYQPPSMGSNGNNFSTQITMLTKCSPTTRRSSSCQDHLSAL
uniref:Vasoactive intestinal peptide receptor 1a n=1 Tax=Gadus morhua TaxID=8049 RepID=A0A8C5CXV3_GADMO